MYHMFITMDVVLKVIYDTQLFIVRLWLWVVS